MISLTFTPGRNDDLISRLPGGKIVLIERGARRPLPLLPCLHYRKQQH